MRIRPADPREAAALTALGLKSKAHWGYDAAFMAACVAELTVLPEHVARNEVWLAEDGTPAGFYELIDQGGGAGEVRMFFVEPARIGTGLGAVLWDHMESRARARGLDRLGLDADPNARGFYQRMGCEVTGTSPSGSIPGRWLPRLEKRLEPMARAARARR
jgi:GNAT superfamily N-acetyltransferase